ncbi:MAG: type II toxin-antitoxin system RelE/ParE family toxin [Gemmatimonadales bacterium]|nr:type II toxin-antitoxin system RelE/ParE family toxin [Gemmatimonadales bacterium]
MPRLSLRSLAEADLGEAFIWYQQQARGLGFEYLRAVDATFAQIRRTPQLYPLVYGQARRALVRRFPYAIYYVVAPDVIHVIACIHTRRHARRWQSRLDT